MGYGTIRAYVGANGSGKTLAAVVQGALQSWHAGRPVASNMPLYPEVAGFDSKLYIPLVGWKGIVEARDCTLILDEITSCLPSRAFSSVPAELQRVLNQLRKQDVDLHWTAPNWARCDVLLREVTQEVVHCQSYIQQRYQRDSEGLIRDDRGRRQRTPARWPNKKLFRWATYDAQQFDDYQDRRQDENFKPKFIDWYWRGRKKVGPWCYTTLAPVALLDHLDDVGRCVHCNRQRKKVYCGCTITDDEAGSAEGAEAKS